MSSHRGTPKPQFPGGALQPDAFGQHAVLDQFGNEDTASMMWSGSMVQPQGTETTYIDPNLTLHGEQHQYDFGEEMPSHDRHVGLSQYADHASNTPQQSYLGTFSQNRALVQPAMAALESTIAERLQDSQDPHAVTRSIMGQYPRYREEAVAAKVHEVHKRIAHTYWTTEEEIALKAKMQAVDGNYWLNVREHMSETGWLKRSEREYIVRWNKIKPIASS